MAASSPQFFVLAPVAIPRRLERLALDDSERSNAADTATLERSAAAITDAGFVARIVSTVPPRIVGGRRKVERDGLVTYDGAFSLWRENDGAYYASLAAPDRGNLGNRSDACRSLDEAVAFLLVQLRTTPESGR